MRYGFLLIVSFLAGYGSTNAQAAASKLRQLNEQWLRAIVNRDTVALGSILDPDFILINFKGNKTNRRDNLNGLLSNEIRFKSVQTDSVEVRMINADTGIVTCWTSFSYLSYDKEYSGKNCYQDVYVRRKGKWKAIAAHVTMLSNE